jgi:DNA-binding GntR family transcriptional regulator
MHHCPSTRASGLVELRQLLEARVVRSLASRGLSFAECARARKLAEATVRMAGRADAPGYLRADIAFHQYLLGLADAQAQAEVACMLVAADGLDAVAAAPSRQLAHGHYELVRLLAEGQVSAADQLIRLHLAGRPATRVPAGVPAGRDPVDGARVTWLIR